MRDKEVSFIGTLDFPGEEIFTLIPSRSSFGYRARFVIMKALFKKLPCLEKKEMSKKIVLKGKVHKFGNDVNTDYIISGRYKFKSLNMKELSTHIFEDIRPGFFKEIVREILL